MKDSFLNSNPWLRDPARRAAMLRVSAASSSAIEGIFKPFRELAASTVKRPLRKRATSERAPG